MTSLLSAFSVFSGLSPLLAQADGAAAAAAAATASDPARPWTLTFIGITFLVYFYIGWRSRVRSTKGFYVAGQGVPAIANGAATAADWMSAASFISMAGLISFSGSDGAVYLLGWTGGYVLLALLLAPYLRKFGHYTVPDFIGARYYSETARVVAAICALFVSITYVAGQMKGVGVVFSRFLEISPTLGVVIGMVIVGLFAVLGGMKGITWTQVAQYGVLIFAFLIPSVAISAKLTGTPIPQAAFVFSDIPTKLNLIMADLGYQVAYTQPFGKFTKLNVFMITAALMFGTAGLPHVIVRFYTVKNVRAARYSAVWAILFIAILYLTAPALGMFARYNIIDSLHQSRIESVEIQEGKQDRKILPFDGDRELAYAAISSAQEKNKGKPGSVKIIYNVVSKNDEPQDWAARWQATGLLALDDLDRDGNISLTLLDPDKKNSEMVKLDRDIIVLSTPEVAKLPVWVIALVAAGGLAAALSTAAGLLLVISSSLAHDLWCRFVTPDASEAKKVLTGRIAIIFGLIVAGYFGINPPGFVGEVVAFAFGLAAASFFPAIFLGIFFKRVNRAGAVTGMIVGLAFTFIYIVMCTTDKLFPWIDAPMLTSDQWLFGSAESQGISPQGIGTLGMVINMVITLTISYLTAPPPKEIHELIESVRVPSGSGEASAH